MAQAKRRGALKHRPDPPHELRCFRVHFDKLGLAFALAEHESVEKTSIAGEASGDDPADLRQLTLANLQSGKIPETEIRRLRPSRLPAAVEKSPGRKAHPVGGACERVH